VGESLDEISLMIDFVDNVGKPLANQGAWETHRRALRKRGRRGNFLFEEGIRGGCLDVVGHRWLVAEVGGPVKERLRKIRQKGESGGAKRAGSSEDNAHPPHDLWGGKVEFFRAGDGGTFLAIEKKKEKVERGEGK